MWNLMVFWSLNDQSHIWKWASSNIIGVRQVAFWNCQNQCTCFLSCFMPRSNSTLLFFFVSFIILNYFVIKWQKHFKSIEMLKRGSLALNRFDMLKMDGNSFGIVIKPTTHHLKTHWNVIFQLIFIGGTFNTKPYRCHTQTQNYKILQRHQ